MREVLARTLCRANASAPWPNLGFEQAAQFARPSRRAIRPGFQRRYESSKSSEEQKIPLDGYYADILSSSTSTTADGKPATPSTPASATLTEKEERDARARIVFGTRLAGPERHRDLEAGSKIIAGVKVPPRPVEPDNCCMSGCVNCVWDRYRDEFEEWVAANTEAQSRLHALSAQGDAAGTKVVASADPSGSRSLQTGIGAVPTHMAVSMDDDGGGRETNWTAPMSSEDLLSGIPVGIREFMRTEKMLKQRHAHEKHSGG